MFLPGRDDHSGPSNIEKRKEYEAPVRADRSCGGAGLTDQWRQLLPPTPIEPALQLHTIN
jgi:hypothetical protein